MCTSVRLDECMCFLFISSLFLQLTSGWRSAQQLRDALLQLRYSALQRARAATHARQLLLEFVHDVDCVTGQIRELEQQRAQAEPAHARQVRKKDLRLTILPRTR